MNEIIQLTENARLLVEVDQSPENPRADWFMATGFVDIPDAGDTRNIPVLALYEWPELADAHDRMDAGRYAYRPTIVAPDGTKGGWIVEKISRTPIEDRVARWARIYHGKHVEYDSLHGGYWFVDEAFLTENWPDGKYPDGATKAEWEAKIIAGERSTYESWADGEVYVVVLERRKKWVEVTTGGVIVGGSQMETWEQAEAIGGCYLDDDYTAQHVANEHWELSDEEQAALGLDAPAVQ